jgi:hypothetical protein
VRIDAKLIFRVAKAESASVDLDGGADLTPTAPSSRRSQAQTRLGLIRSIGCRHFIVSMLERTGRAWPGRVRQSQKRSYLFTARRTTDAGMLAPSAPGLARSSAGRAPRGGWPLGSKSSEREQGASQVNLTPTEGVEVRIGSRVWVRDGDGDDEFTIVAAHDADACADRVSVESPCGRALLGHHVGDRVRFRAPGGIVGLTVVAIDGAQ